MGFKGIDKLTEPFLQLHEWDSGAERIVHTTTIQILLCFGFVMSSNLLFGQPIACQMLPETPESATNYFHDYCFYQDKLRISNQVSVKRFMNQGTMSVNYQTREEIAVSYYQWVPFIIFLQVAMCIVPALLWKFFGLHFFYGSDFASIIRHFFLKKDEILMEKGFCKIAARETYRWLEHKKREKFGMYATMAIYVFMKWLTFISLLMQFYMMANIYASGELLWGVHISYDLLNGVYKNVFSGVFPQIVGCKPHRSQLGNVVNEFVMRCILPQNFINSKVFLFLYWWYVLAMLVSIVSALRYTVMLLVPRYQRYATKSLLPTQEFFLEQAGQEQHSVIPGDSDPLEYFVDYLGNDGFLLLQCSSVPLSVVSVRVFVNVLYDVVVIKGGIEEDPIKEEPLPKKPEDLPIGDIEFDGAGDRKHCGKENFGEGGSKKSLLTDDCFEPLLPYQSSPSCSTDSYQDRCTSASGKSSMKNKKNLPKKY